MKTVRYTVPNINCMHCVHTIQSEVAELAGVQSVKADAGNKQVEIIYDDPATEDKIKSLMADIKYPIAV